MFPIRDGKYFNDESPTDDYKFSSSLKVAHKIKILVYIISLEDGIKIIKHPIFNMYPVCENGRSKIIRSLDKSDLFYKRFLIQ